MTSVVFGRCMRRCLDCENVAKFIDRDDRRHLCNRPTERNAMSGSRLYRVPCR